MTYAGCDPSVTSTGLSVYRDGRYSVERVKPPAGSTDPGRLLWIAEQVASRFTTREPLILAIEDHGGQTGHGAANIALHWMIRAQVALRANSRVLVVAPATLKKFVTGSGVAEKGTVAATIVRAWGDLLPDEALQEDALDGFALCQLARAWGGADGYNAARVAVAKTQRVVKGEPQARAALADTAGMLPRPVAA